MNTTHPGGCAPKLTRSEIRCEAEEDLILRSIIKSALADLIMRLEG
jgi:hypothetical protein